MNKAPTITFKAKIKEGYCYDPAQQNLILARYIPVPTFTRNHCDMNAFRIHRRFGDYANSDLFPAILRRLRGKIFPDGQLRLDSIPPGVAVDESKFLAVVTVDVEAAGGVEK